MKHSLISLLFLAVNTFAGYNGYHGKDISWFQELGEFLGSLGIVFLFMPWIWIPAIVVFVVWLLVMLFKGIAGYFESRGAYKDFDFSKDKIMQRIEREEANL